MAKVILYTPLKIQYWSSVFKSYYVRFGDTDLVELPLAQTEPGMECVGPDVSLFPYLI